MILCILYYNTAFDAWLQHFDSTKGCFNICILDMPVINYSTNSFSLWRRLLLGEGDRRDQPQLTPVKTSKMAEIFKKSQSYHHHTKEGIGYTPILTQNTENPFFPYEEKAQFDDQSRIGIKLALALQRASFPYVSVLEGSIPALIKQLLLSRGTVEPIIINHNQEIWETYIQNYDISSNSSNNNNSIRNTTNNVNNDNNANNANKNLEEPKLQNKLFSLLADISETFSNTNKNDNSDTKPLANNNNANNNTTNNSYNSNNNNNNISNDKSIVNTLPYLGLINPETLNYEYVLPSSDVTSYTIDNLTQFIQSSTVIIHCSTAANTISNTNNTNIETDTNRSSNNTNTIDSSTQTATSTTASFITNNKSLRNEVIKNMKKLCILYSQNLSQVERYEMAYYLAKKLGHKHIEAILAERIYNH